MTEWYYKPGPCADYEEYGHEREELAAAMGAEHDGDRFVMVGDYWYELVDDDSGDEPDVTTPAGHLAASFSRIAGRPLRIEQR